MNVAPVSTATWQDHARCSDHGLEFWFAEDANHAKAYCSTCPVWQHCLNHGIDEHEGIWGGLTRTERLRLRRLRSRVADAPSAPQNAIDVRYLISRADLTPERLSVAAGIDLKTITAWANEPGPRRRTKRRPRR